MGSVAQLAKVGQGDLDFSVYQGRSMRISMQDYKSLCPAVTICDTLVNRHTDTI